jgi:Helix-turn-helix
MSARMQMPHTKQSSGRVILHTVGPAVRLQEVCSALAELGFAIIPVSDTTSTDPLWTTSVEDATPVTLTMLPDDALVPATAAVPDLLGPHRVGQTLAGARGKEGLSQRQLAALTGIPQRHISEMENGKRPIGKANAKILGKALKVDYRVLL